MTHPLRDLAAKIRAVCQEHPAYSQAIDIVTNCTDHLDAVARTHEADAEIRSLETKQEPKL